MVGKLAAITFHRRPSFSAERLFHGSVLDVARARQFARATSRWWGVDPRPVEQLVGELARRAVCRQVPGFVLKLMLADEAVRVDVQPAPPGVMLEAELGAELEAELGAELEAELGAGVARAAESAAAAGSWARATGPSRPSLGA